MRNHRIPRYNTNIYDTTKTDPYYYWNDSFKNSEDKSDNTKKECIHNFELQKGFNFDFYECSTCKMTRNLIEEEK